MSGEATKPCCEDKIYSLADIYATRKIKAGCHQTWGPDACTSSIFRINQATGNARPVHPLDAF